MSFRFYAFPFPVLSAALCGFPYSSIHFAFLKLMKIFRRRFALQQNPPKNALSANAWRRGMQGGRDEGTLAIYLVIMLHTNFCVPNLTQTEYCGKACAMFSGFYRYRALKFRPGVEDNTILTLGKQMVGLMLREQENPNAFNKIN